MARLVFQIISLGVCCFSTEVAVGKGTPCNLRIPLLNYNYTNANINATSSMDYYTPSEARITDNGWCAESMCRVKSERQYLQVDFGAEVVVEAIAIGIVDSRRHHYVREYHVEYGSNESQSYHVISEDSNTTVFNVDVCNGGNSVNVINFAFPVVTRFIRVVPLQWNNPYPCLRLELYGCLVEECSQIRAISNNNSILPTDNIDYSPHNMHNENNMNISTQWCSYHDADMSPSVLLTFVEPVYLLYALGSFYYTDFSITYKNSFGKNITYMNMDGIYKFQLTSDERDQLLLWQPINTTQLALQLNIPNYYMHTSSCITIIFYGCTSGEVINHASDEVSPAITSSVQQTSVITVTTTISATAVVTPQSSCSCPGQQQTSASSSSSDSDVVTIVTPVVVVLVVIILILLVVIGVLLWRKAKHRSDTPPSKVLVENDLYGMETSLRNSMANKNNSLDAGAEGNRSYEYPTMAAQPSLPTATYDTVAMSLHEEDASETGTKTNIYSELS